MSVQDVLVLAALIGAAFLLWWVLVKPTL